MILNIYRCVLFWHVRLGSCLLAIAMAPWLSSIIVVGPLTSVWFTSCCQLPGIVVNQCLVLHISRLFTLCLACSPYLKASWLVQIFGKHYRLNRDFSFIYYNISIFINTIHYWRTFLSLWSSWLLRSFLFILWGVIFRFFWWWLWYFKQIGVLRLFYVSKISFIEDNISSYYNVFCTFIQ